MRFCRWERPQHTRTRIFRRPGSGQTQQDKEQPNLFTRKTPIIERLQNLNPWTPPHKGSRDTPQYELTRLVGDPFLFHFCVDSQ